MTQISAKIIADSKSVLTGTRITTLELSYHRFIHSEFMTHRVFSRNASSSRAIPVKTLMDQVENDPMMPIYWGSNKPGMQAGDELTGTELQEAKESWLRGARETVKHVYQLEWLHVHKQIANRLLEPYLPIKVVVTATEWDNFFKLREHKDAQPEIQKLAHKMHEAMANSTPEILHPGEWHLPYITPTEHDTMTVEEARKASSARCARVSYLNHDKSECTLEEDLGLFNMLATRPYKDNKRKLSFSADDPVHLSPTEHQATPIDTDNIDKYYASTAITHLSFKNNKFGNQFVHWSGNLRNWVQFRQIL